MCPAAFYSLFLRIFLAGMRGSSDVCNFNANAHARCISDKPRDGVTVLVEAEVEVAGFSFSRQDSCRGQEGGLHLLNAD